MHALSSCEVHLQRSVVILAWSAFGCRHRVGLARSVMIPPKSRGGITCEALVDMRLVMLPSSASGCLWARTQWPTMPLDCLVF
mmetsp:Transcript_44536/g.142831  ORF Transcript_44536/g.142831 Transcript_44536/m.142831 type:complete len:83 (+) Transcript_44536:299-547(+)